MAGKLEKQHIEKLKKLAPDLGFKACSNQKYADGHYFPDLVWYKNNKTVGFEVEYGKVTGKKIVGDAFWLSRTFDVGFIQVVYSERYERFKKLIDDIKEDFEGNVYVISTDNGEIKTILKQRGLMR